MRRHRSSLTRVAGLLVLAATLSALAWSILPGCKSGQGPHSVIDPNGQPPDFLPPGGLAPGITHELGLLYKFDRTSYQMYGAVAGTSGRYVRRDSVLAPRGLSPSDLSLRVPDANDAALKAVYDDPRLFGFVSGGPSEPDRWLAGDVLNNASEFFPLQPGNTWTYNHNSLQWTRTDNVLDVDDVATAKWGVNVYRVRYNNVADPNLGPRYYKPNIYDADILVSSGAGGISFYGWTLVAERQVSLLDRGCLNCQPQVQRNPLFLWLSLGGLSTGTIDQCLDGLPGNLEFSPVRLCGDNIQVGDIYSTWTYLGVSREDLRQRLNTEPPIIGRCGIEFVVGHDTLRTFPTGTFKLFCKFVVRAERAYDQLRWIETNIDKGHYGAADGNLDVIKFTINMYVAGAGGDTQVQYMEIYYARNIGEVVRRTGANFASRSTTRLKTATINGQVHPPTEFGYVD